MDAKDVPSTRPYLIRALFEWCTESGYTPHLAVMAGAQVQVPREFVQNGEIVLNISPDATSGLQIGNEWIEFKARFNGVARDILVPVDHVLAIYARENGQGMAFPAPVPAAGRPGHELSDVSAKPTDLSPDSSPDLPPDPPPVNPRPTLTRIK